MEKYYLAKLAVSREKFSEFTSKGNVKLVDVQYTRRPSTFGLVQLEELLDKKQHTLRQQQLSMVVLELADDKTAKLRVDKQINLADYIDSSDWIVDFDTNKTIFMDDTSVVNNERQPPDCVLMTRNGDLYAINMARNECVKLLTSGCEGEQQRPLRWLLHDKSFVKCKLQMTADECFVHTLADRYYAVYKLSSSKLHKLELSHEYSLSKTDPQLRFTGICATEVNPQLVVLELSDCSLQIVKDSKCVHCITLSSGENPSSFNLKRPYSHSLLSTSQTNDEYLLISFCQTQIIAHNIQVNSRERSRGHLNSTINQHDEDPDQLLLKEPSFEVEKCWSIELGDLECNRSLDQSQTSNSSLTVESCFMWSANQLNPESCWPKYLVIVYEFHVLVYSFEQPVALPFSVIYDSSFFSFAPDAMQEGSDNSSKIVKAIKSKQEHQENVDVKLRPRLVHNFKLIGPYPVDSLFNTLFLTFSARVVRLEHFSQMGLMVAVTQHGQVMAFKFTSPELTTQKDNLYQQLVIESLRANTLLQLEISRLENENKMLRENLMILERQRQFGKSQLEIESVDASFECQLTVQDHQLGSLYNLLIDLPNFLQVLRIVVVSTVSSYILEPTGQLINATHIDNNITNQQRDTFKNKVDVLTNIEHSGDYQVPVKIEELLDEQHCDIEQIQTWAVLDISSNTNQLIPTNSRITIPLFIMDGQSGHLKIFYLLNKPDSLRLNQDLVDVISIIGQENDYDENNDQTTLCSTVIKIKPLMSYKLEALQEDSRDSHGHVKITGSFNSQTMMEWLSGCFHLEGEDKLAQTSNQMKFYSSFTHCHIECSIPSDGNQLDLFSDDFTALELIKKHLLERATDGAIQLDVHDSLPTIWQLRHLISRQRKNISILTKKLSFDKHNRKPRSGDQMNLLMDTITSEMVDSDISADNDMTNDWLIKSFRDDILMVVQNESDSTKNGMIPEEIGEKIEKLDELDIFRDLVFGFIIDAHVDYDRLQGSKPASDYAILLMRERLLQLTSSQKDCELNYDLDQVPDEWSNIKGKKSYK